MAIGKHTSLEEARKEKKLNRFCKEHPSTGDEDAFDSLFHAMARTNGVRLTAVPLIRLRHAGLDPVSTQALQKLDSRFRENDMVVKIAIHVQSDLH